MILTSAILQVQEMHILSQKYMKHCATLFLKAVQFQKMKLKTLLI